MGKETLFKSKLIKAKDIYSFIALANRHKFDLCFFKEAVLGPDGLATEVYLACKEEISDLLASVYNTGIKRSTT